MTKTTQKRSAKPMSRVQKLEWELKLAKLAAAGVRTVNSSALAIGDLVMSGQYELVKVADGPTVEPPIDDAAAESLYAAALEHAHARAEKLRALRLALEQNAKEPALLLARELCGLQQKGADDEAGNRAAPRIH